jgi:hypothetical protein
MTSKDIFRASADAHIQELLDSIEHHERHLQSTEAVSLDTHLLALEKIKQKQKTLESHWHKVAEAVDQSVEGLKHAFNRTHD